MSTESPGLYVVCLGGRAEGCTVELHDIVFAVGEDLEATHAQLLEQWFGQADGLHIDAWTRVDRVPGFRVYLDRSPPASDTRLFFVNIGGYVAGELWERHAYALYAGRDKADVKARARRELLSGHASVHRDDLYAIDDVLEVRIGPEWHIHLQADETAGAPEVTNGYVPIPRRTIEDWRRGRVG